MAFPPTHPALQRALAAQGYEEPTPVQREVLEGAADGADLLVSAQTGSGKTVAFGLAMAGTLLGEPEAVIAETLGVAGEFGAVGQGLGRVAAFDNGGEIENGKLGHPGHMGTQGRLRNRDIAFGLAFAAPSAPKSARFRLRTTDYHGFPPDPSRARTRACRPRL